MAWATIAFLGPRFPKYEPDKSDEQEMSADPAPPEPPFEGPSITERLEAYKADKGTADVRPARRGWLRRLRRDFGG